MANSNVAWHNPEFERQLTAKMAQFAEEYNRNGNKPVPAHRFAYDCNGTDAEIRKKAKKLLDDERVIWYLGVLQDGAVEETGYTLDKHIKKLEEIRDAALADENFSAATAAERAIGTAMGHQSTTGSRSLPPDPTANHRPSLNILRPNREG